MENPHHEKLRHAIIIHDRKNSCHAVENSQHGKFKSPNESPRAMENLCHEKNHLMLWEIHVTKKNYVMIWKACFQIPPIQQKFTLCPMFFLGVFVYSQSGYNVTKVLKKWL